MGGRIAMKRVSILLFAIIFVLAAGVVARSADCSNPEEVWKQTTYIDVPVDSDNAPKYIVQPGESCSLGKPASSKRTKQIMLYMGDGSFDGPMERSADVEGTLSKKPGFYPAPVVWRVRVCTSSDGNTPVNAKHVGPARTVSHPDGDIPADVAKNNWYFVSSQSTETKACGKVGYYVAMPQLDMTITETKTYSKKSPVGIRAVYAPAEKPPPPEPVVQPKGKPERWSGVPDVPKNN